MPRSSRARTRPGWFFRAALLLWLTASARGETAPEGPWRPEALLFWADYDRSAETGADGLIALRYALGRAEDAILPPRPWDEERLWPHLGGFAYRLGRLALVDEPLNIALATFDHEYFGHGYRGREAGFPRIHYGIGLPPPYGRGGGWTRFLGRPESARSLESNVIICAAGEEAEGVAADRLRAMWMQAGSMGTGEAPLYLHLRDGLRNYLAGSDETDGGDMSGYVRYLNAKENGKPRQDWDLHLDRIRARQHVALIDPFFWYSFWAVLRTGLWRGESRFDYPALRMGPARFLPAVDYGLSPWGPEYRVEALCGWAGRAVILGYRFGDDTFRRSWGLDAATSGLFRGAGLIVDIDAHFWEQPGLRSEDSRPRPRSAGFAGMLQVLSPAAPGGPPVRLAAGLGWKTPGWLRGKALGAGPEGRLGLAWAP